MHSRWGEARRRAGIAVTGNPYGVRPSLLPRSSPLSGEERGLRGEVRGSTPHSPSLRGILQASVRTPVSCNSNVRTAL